MSDAVLVQLCNVVEAQGGIIEHAEEGTVDVAGGVMSDCEWPDLADTYVAATRALGIKPLTPHCTPDHWTAYLGQDKYLLIHLHDMFEQWLGVYRTSEWDGWRSRFDLAAIGRRTTVRNADQQSRRAWLALVEWVQEFSHEYDVRVHGAGLKYKLIKR